jgi:leucyl-tRNA synthetase
MQRYNFKTAEEKWQKIWKEKKSFKTSIKKIKKNFIVWKCFLIPRAAYIWDM